MEPKARPSIVGTHFFLACGWVPVGLDGETVDDMLTRIYGAFVDNYIRKCQAKAELSNCDDSKLRSSALPARVKSKFMQTNRPRLIEHLMAQNTPLEAYRIEYHLNRKYAESLHPQDVYTALLKAYVNK